MWPARQVTVISVFNLEVRGTMRREMRRHEVNNKRKTFRGHRNIRTPSLRSDSYRYTVKSKQSFNSTKIKFLNQSSIKKCLARNSLTDAVVQETALSTILNTLMD